MWIHFSNEWMEQAASRQQSVFGIITVEPHPYRTVPSWKRGVTPLRCLAGEPFRPEHPRPRKLRGEAQVPFYGTPQSRRKHRYADL